VCVCLCLDVSVLHSRCFIDFKKAQYFYIFANFPFIFHAGPFEPEQPKCDYFFYNHLDYSHPVPNFFGCSNTKYQQSHQISDHSEEAVIFKNVLFKFFGSIWAEQPQRVKDIAVCPFLLNTQMEIFLLRSVIVSDMTALKVVACCWRMS